MIRSGFTVAELVVTLTLIGILAGIARPAWRSWSDQVAVWQATHDVLGFYRSARIAAVARGATVEVVFSANRLRAHLWRDSTRVVIDRAGPARRGVGFQATRSRIRIGPAGVGVGPANTTLTVIRGKSVDSLVISRLGRIRQAHE